MRRNMSIADRCGAATGAAYIVLINVGNQLASGNSQDAHPSGAKDLADFSGTPTAAQQLGFTMEVLGFVVFMFFLGWLVNVLRARGGAWSWLPTVAGVGGIVTLAVKLGSASPILTGELDHDRLSPGLARVLADMNGSSFVVTFLPFAVYVLAAAGSMLATGFAGRVAGWAGVLIGVLGLVAPLLSRLDPVDTNVVPFLLGMLWTLAVSVRFTVWGPKAPRAGQDPVTATAVRQVAGV